MKLTQMLARQVSSKVRSRGASYFAAGAVEDLALNDGIIEATVEGTEPYTVRLEPGDELVRADCTCPFFFDRLEICKHIWAVVLAAEAQALPLVPPHVPFEHVYLDAADPDWVPGDDGVLEDSPAELLSLPAAWEESAYLSPEDVRGMSVLAKQRWAQITGRSRQKKAAPEPWQLLLQTISLTTPAAPGAARPRVVPDQLVYVIDADASRAAGILVIELMTRDRKKNGEWGRPKAVTLTGADVRALPACDDRLILEKLLGAQPDFGWGPGVGYGHQLARLRLGGVLVPELVPRICETTRALVRVQPDGDESVDARRRRGTPRPLLLPLAWDDGEPWTFHLQIRADSAHSGYLVEGSFRRGDERMAVTEPLLVLADGVLITRTVAAPLDHGGAFAWLAWLRETGPLTIPLEARRELTDALLAQPLQHAEVTEELRVETIQGQPRPRLRLQRPGAYSPDRLVAETSFDYEGQIVKADDARPVILFGDTPQALRRDMSAEREALAHLERLGCRYEWGGQQGRQVLQLPAGLVPRTVRELLALGWHVEADGRSYRRAGTPTLEVRSGIDWFELHGEVFYGDRVVRLPTLLAALERGESFVTLDDGTVGLLPEEWLRKQGTLARFGAVTGDHLRFRPSQAALLDALLAAQPEVTWDDTFARARDELKGFRGIRPEDPPATFRGTLRGYQREGLGWLMFLQRFGFGGCLADDMGLGKTVMVLALLEARRGTQPAGDRRRSLAVVPRSLVFNWLDEAARFTPGLRILPYVGPGRAALRARFDEVDLVVTTYGTLRRDATHLSAIAFDYVVLDEAQAIKNAQTASAKASRLMTSRHRVALSGTPVENHLGELGSLFEFLNPGLLGRAAFTRVTGSGGLDEEQVGLLAQGLRPFILRRTKAQVAPELPAKTEQTMYCELERPQRTLYDELRTHYRNALLKRVGNNGLSRSKLQILEALLRLRQAACHPGLIDKARATDASAKLDVLLPRLLEAAEEGHKTLVFSQFTSLLAILRRRLDESGMTYEYLDGRTRDREARVSRFQRENACRLFLISLKAGGLGLNLTAAEYVFLLDPWWNPAVETQAIDRAHRIGQSRPVFAYRLIARDTVEEHVLELQSRKRRLADAIVTADKSLLRDLRREDLELLLS